MSRSAVIVTSGAYVSQELSAEFGLLPSAFVPVGMRRLYELQFDMLADMEASFYLTLPESMELPEWDAAQLSRLGFTLLRSPDGLSLGAAVLYALASIGFDSQAVRILHGDTLFDGLDLEALDSVAIATRADGYPWAVVHDEDGEVAAIEQAAPTGSKPGDLLLAGYFAFSNATELARALAHARGDFIEALNQYNQARPLKTQRGARWLDFGHVQTFFRSRRDVSTARSFNDLLITETSVRKRSIQADKLKAEAHWFKSIPPPLKPYTARLTEEGQDGDGYYYITDYEYMPTLAELYVFGRLNRPSWLRILTSCRNFLEAALQQAPPGGKGVLQSLTIDKTFRRLDDFARQTGFDLDRENRLNGSAAPSLRVCADDAARFIASIPGRSTVMHGDFCFSNILYSPRMERIRLIDPRGFVDGAPTIYGDLHYDIAKLSHSLVGHYDAIIAGRFVCSDRLDHDLRLELPSSAETLWLERASEEIVIGDVGVGSQGVLALVITLFLSMLPLHADRPDRQCAFMANALRLHRRWRTAAV